MFNLIYRDSKEKVLNVMVVLVPVVKGVYRGTLFEALFEAVFRAV